MWYLQVLIEHGAWQLDRPFTYSYQGKLDKKSGFRVKVNFNNQPLVGYVLDAFKEGEGVMFDDLAKIKPIIEIIDQTPLLNDELINLALTWSEQNFISRIKMLQVMLPPSLKPARSSLRGPKIHYQQYVKVIDENEDDLTLKQIEWLHIIKREQPFKRKGLKSATILKALIDKKKVMIENQEVFKQVASNYPVSEKPILTSDQHQVIKQVINRDGPVFLLHGVTGSGKTEVYLSLSEISLNNHQQVLIIVPEIALTPMMVAYFKHRFHENVAILHSELTSGQKYDEYRRIQQGRANIVVGARSAIFAPLQRIGLIIIDEEHVETYKQDVNPFYHVRDIAFLRAKHHQAKVILGSATPSLESMARAKKNIYTLLSLPKRINQLGLPEATIVNMLDASQIDNQSSLFSKLLRQNMAKALNNKQQIILLLNRRGYALSVSCRSCGHLIKCPTCHIPLTYHKGDQMMKCHYCDYLERPPKSCPNCDGQHFLYQGFGTERIVNETERLFPEARILRLDSDSGKVRETIAKTINSFANYEADILVGTQMVAKGHDFPKVALVGIVLADIGLSIPSFRSSERTFQLITQAVGRSGRATTKGQAIIQTYSPTHYAILSGSQQNYDAFYQSEIKYRQLANYPPFAHIISLMIQGRDELLVIETITTIFGLLDQALTGVGQLIGPSTPYLNYFKGEHHRYLLIKCQKLDLVRPHLKMILDLLRSKSGIKMQINVNPYDV